MDIIDAIELRNEMKTQINRLIKSFEAKTRLLVTDIKLDNDRLSETRKVMQHWAPVEEVEVKLPK